MCRALNYHSRRNENLRAEKRPAKERRLRRRYPEYAFPYPRSGYTDKRDAYLLLIAFSNITTWQLRPITLLLRKHTRMCLILSKLSTRIESCRLSCTSFFFLAYIGSTLARIEAEPTSAGVIPMHTRELDLSLRRKPPLNGLDRPASDYPAEK